MTPSLDQTFAHSWVAHLLPGAPAIWPSRRYVFPQEAEEVERGALFVQVQPARAAAPWTGVFALGFADPALPSGVWTCPHPDQLCVLAGGYAYLVDTLSPARFQQVPYRPVYAVLATREPVPRLLFAGARSLLAYGENGLAWESVRVSDEGISDLSVGGDWLHGTGWRLQGDREEPFRLNLRDGRLP